jgi:hypothetical protein
MSKTLVSHEQSLSKIFGDDYACSVLNSHFGG